MFEKSQSIRINSNSNFLHNMIQNVIMMVHCCKQKSKNVIKERILIFGTRLKQR